MSFRSLTAHLKPYQRIICAYDSSQLSFNDQLTLTTLGQHIGMWKIGYQAITARTPKGTVATAIMRRLDQEKLPWFYDGKLKDIQNTVVESVKNLCQDVHIAPKILTVHATMRVETIARALEAAGPHTLVAGVTLLTDHDEEDASDIYYQTPPEVVLRCEHRLLKASELVGIKAGMVCSPRELQFLKSDLVKITPGIRDKDAPLDDQKRTMTAAEAILHGADYVVIGRPILKASNPIVAAQRFAADIASVT